MSLSVEKAFEDVPLTDVEKEIEFDKQLFALAGFALISLILVIIVIFVGLKNSNVIQASFERSVNNTIAEIQALMPPAFRIANSVLTTFENLATNVFNGVTFAVVQGAQAVINVILTIGGTLLETIQTSLKLILDQLGDIGSQVLVFFENVFTPVVNFVERSGETITLFLGLVYAIFSPILTFINAIIRAIDRIGSIFPTPPDNPCSFTPPTGPGP